MSSKNYRWMFSDLAYSRNLDLYHNNFKKGKIASIRRNPYWDLNRNVKPYFCAFFDKPKYEFKDLKSTTLQDAKKEAEVLVIERLAEQIISLRNEIEEVEMLIEDFIQEVENDKQ